MDKDKKRYRLRNGHRTRKLYTEQNLQHTKNKNNNTKDLQTKQKQLCTFA